MKLFLKIKGKTAFLLFTALLVFSSGVFGQKKYSIQYLLTDKDSLYKDITVALKNTFNSQEEAISYVKTLPEILLAKGYPVASVDSVYYDSTFASVNLYPGPKYSWGKINTDSIETGLLDRVRVYPGKGNFSLNQLPLLQEKILNYYEDNGYPFARVSMENVHISGNFLSGDLIIHKGITYTIDSIKVHGTAKIKNKFLQNYLDIQNGSLYNRQKLKQISRQLKNLPYLEEMSPWNLSMLGSGAILNLYLNSKKSSRVDVLVGFLPGNDITGKTQITADVNLDLKNALGSGENILVNWQQLQPQSPRLKLGYSHPYILNSRFGTDFSFDLLKRDSAFLQLSAMLGINYTISPESALKVFYQNENSYLLAGGLDTMQVLISKKLPPNIDVRAGNFGLGYEFINTDYRFNPRKGTELSITGSAGIKKISKNNDILQLKDSRDPGFDFKSLYDSIELKSYRLRIIGHAAQYINITGNSVLKFAANGGILQSPQIFQNELFRIGGYHLLRGFAEESIYANQYAVFTTEYRYLIGTNSFFFAFSDGALTKTNMHQLRYSNAFISGGVGLEFETKVGLLNISLAVGKRDDVKFDLRNSSKIHFGYINYF